MSEKALCLIGSIKKIWMIAKDQAGRFSMADVSFTDMLICWIQNISWGFLISVKALGQVNRIPFPYHCHPMPSCRTELLLTPEKAATVCYCFTKEYANHTSSWQLKTFLWRSQHTEVSKAYFGCKIYCLTFPRDYVSTRWWWFHFRTLISSI